MRGGPNLAGGPGFADRCYIIYASSKKRHQDCDVQRI